MVTNHVSNLLKIIISTFTNFQYVVVHITIVSPGKGLVTNYGEGGGYKTVGGAHEILPLRKGGGGGVAEKFLAMLKEGGTTSFGVVFMW